nr:unnamed protein product [Digitaria exilis]
MTSSAPTNPSPPVPVPVPVSTPPPTANGAASSPKDQPPPQPQQQQQAGGQEESAAAAADGGGGAEAAEAGVVAGAAGEAMEVDGGPGAGDAEAGGAAGGGGGGGTGGGAQQASPATVFRIRLKQSPASLRHKMRVPELCRNFSNFLPCGAFCCSAVAWCGKLNAIACASETCARIPSSNSSPPFWIPIHILNPERPTECSVFNVKADSPRDFVQFIEWSPRSCPRALLVANFHGRITIWTQPNKGPVNLVRDASSWQCEHEWRQDLSVVTKWLSGTSPYRWLPANSTSSNLKTFEEKFLSQQPQSSGQYMSPYDPDEGPSITGWRVQCWESSLQPVVLHPIFGSPTSFGGQPPMQTVWSTRVNKSIPPTEDLKNPQTYVPMPTTSDERSSSECSVDRANRLSFDPYDLPNDVRQLAQIVYSAHGGEVSVAFLRGGVHIFSGPNFDQVDSYHVNVGSAIAPPAFSSSSCCLASVWHDTLKDRTILKIIRVLPPAILSTQTKVNSAAWERAIADRFWWSLLAGVDWWDAVGCTQSAAEDGIVSLNSVIAFLDADFHSLPTMQQRQQHCPVSVGYVDAVLDLASHFITRLRRYASFCRTLASHVGPSSTTSTSRSMVTSPTNSSPSPSNNQGNPGGATSATGNSQMQEWVQGAIAKISNNSDGAATATPNPMSGRRQAPRLLANAQKNQDSAVHKIQHMMNAKTEDNAATVRSGLGAAKVEDGQPTRGGQFALGAKGPEENPIGKSVRIGSGNAGQGYTSDEVKVLFLILVDLCRRTSTLPHPLPASQVGSNNIIIRLHYIDGNYTVLPEVVEASLGPHMQNMPRPRGADAAGLLLRELELQPPAEEWHRRNMFGGPWSEPDDFGPLDNMLHIKFSGSINPLLSDMEEDHGNSLGIQSLWPRKRRLSERDAAFGLKTSVGLGGYLGVMGSRRDVITAVWRTGLDGEWYKVSMLKAAFNSRHFRVL